MASPKYKLVYFNARGKAEPIRLVFAYKRVLYEDVRLEEHDWHQYKPSKFSLTTVFPNEVPVLQVDGVYIGKTKAIARFLAKEFDMLGSSMAEAANADMLVDGVDDVINQLRPWSSEKDPVAQMKIWSKLEETCLLPFLARYEKQLEDGGKRFFVSDSVNWADLFIFDFLFFLKSRAPRLCSGRRRLNEFFDQVAAIPQISQWLHFRPKTES